jgi:hypothetical protein
MRDLQSGIRLTRTNDRASACSWTTRSAAELERTRQLLTASAAEPRQPALGAVARHDALAALGIALTPPPWGRRSAAGRPRCGRASRSGVSSGLTRPQMPRRSCSSGRCARP